ncbi:MAG: hypothetical protein ACKO9F_16655, partial [Caldilinea sp.]
MIQLRSRPGRSKLMVEALVGVQREVDPPAPLVAPLAVQVRRVGVELQQVVDRFVQERGLGRYSQEQVQ